MSGFINISTRTSSKAVTCIYIYVAKRSSLLQVSEEELEWVMERLNHRPRKVLSWRTPHEMFSSSETNLTVALNSWTRVMQTRQNKLTSL